MHARRWARLLVLLAAACNGATPPDADPAPHDAARDLSRVQRARDGLGVAGASPAAAPGTSARSSGTMTRDPPQAGRPRVVFLGDSLTAGYGLAREQAWPDVVAEQLAELGLSIEAINAGVSGDTSAGGLARLADLLTLQPAIVVVALGGNDGLRGTPLATTSANLRAIVERAQAAGAAVLLCGLQLPPNLGPAYTSGFARIFGTLAEELDLGDVPDLLDGVGGHAALNLSDGIHPNAEGQERLAANVLAALRPLVAEALRRDG